MNSFLYCWASMLNKHCNFLKYYFRVKGSKERRLVEFAMENGIKIMSTNFYHKET